MNGRVFRHSPPVAWRTPTSKSMVMLGTPMKKGPTTVGPSISLVTPSCLGLAAATHGDATESEKASRHEREGRRFRRGGHRGEPPQSSLMKLSSFVGAAWLRSSSSFEEQPPGPAWAWIAKEVFANDAAVVLANMNVMLSPNSNPLSWPDCWLQHQPKVPV